MRISWWTFIGVLGLSAFVQAQATTATLGGVVRDETGAVVPSARIAAVNLATGLQREAMAGDEGHFVLPLLPPGRYTLSAQRDGFNPAEVPELVLNVGDAVEIAILLEVAGVDASVTVTAAPAVVSTSPAVSTVVDRQFVANLPLNGRSFQSLITMTPGIVLTPASSTSPGQFSVNGQRSDANYFMVDGVSANIAVQVGTALGVAGAGAAPGVSAQGGTNSLVSVDAMQEFKIQTSTYAPEFGRTPGGQISIVTRSGTNQFHGSLFEYFRNDALDTADYFVKLQNLPKPKEHLHDFGGVFGGPIQRDRTFVFGSYEGLRLDQPKSAVLEVPSLASRAAASDVLKPTLAAFPVPNGPDTSRGLAQFSTSYFDPSTLNATSVRVDRRMGNAVTVFGRYNYAPSDGSSRLGSFAIASANTIGTLRSDLQTLTGSATWIVSPTVSNDLRVNWSRSGVTTFQTIDDFGGAVPLPESTLHPFYVPLEGSYQINLGPANVLFANSAQVANAQRQLNIVNAVQLARGRHQLKLGIDYRRLIPIYGPAKYNQAYTFNGVSGFLGGAATSVQVIAFSTANRFPHVTNFSAYAQDTWSAASKLTLAYGLRWDLNPPPGLSGTTDALTLATADPAALALAPPGTPMYNTTYGNVAPRLGATYRLRDSSDYVTVLRGGWGIFFDLGSNSVIDNLASAFPFVARRTPVNVAFPTSPALLAPPTIVPGAVVDFLTAADPNLQLPYTHQWNVAIEQGLGAASTVSISYVGAVGRRLLREERLVNPSPQFGQVTLVTNNGHSRYHSLQVKYTRRLSRGLQALTSYTFADSMDNTSSDVIPVLPSARVDPEVDWGPSDFDVRHTFSGGITYSWRGWSADAVFVARSALPVNVLTGTTAFGVSSALRPDVVNGVPFYVDDSSVPGDWRINRAAFVTPPLDVSGNPLRQGTLGRNALRGFAMSQVDLAVRRDIPLGGGANVQLRVEAFNIFNQVSLALPTNTLSSGLFGQPTRTLASGLGAGGVAGGGFSPLFQVGGPRSVQLALKLQF